MKHLLKFLEKVRDKKILCAFYTSEDNPGDFSVGRVLEIEDNSISIRTFEEDCMESSILVLPIDSLHRLESDSRYLKRMNFLLDKVKASGSRQSLIKERVGTILETLSFAKESETLIGVWNKNNDISINGYVLHVDHECAELKTLNSEGEYDGIVIIPLRSITGVQIEGRDQIEFEFIKKHRAEIF